MDNASKVKAMTAAKAGVEAGGEGRRRRPGTEARQVNQGMFHRRTAEGMADCWPGLSLAPSTIGLPWRAFTGPRTAVARATPTPRLNGRCLKPGSRPCTS